MSEENQNMNNQEISKEVEATESSELVVTEKKKFFSKPLVKKLLMGLGMGALAIGSFSVGKAVGSRSNNQEDIDDVDYEVIDNDNTENQ